MGAQQSTFEEGGSEGAPAIVEGQTDAIKLYKFASNKWELEQASTSPNFYDVNEDTNEGKALWWMEAGQVEALVDDFTFEETTKRVTFQGNDGIYALKFPSMTAYVNFRNKYNDKVFENTYSLANTEANRAKIFGKDSLFSLGIESAESREQWVEDMDVDERPSASEKFKEKLPPSAVKDNIVGVKLGAGDRSYIIRDKKIEVLKNVHGGVQDTGVSFDVTPPRRGGLDTPSFTPSKVLLSNLERKMNMLSPFGGEKLYHTDLEKSVIVSEWTFQKDGVDVGMKDIVGDSKGAELTDASTFLGLGTNRLVRWDMRDPTGVVQEMNSPVVGYIGGKDYARNTNFSCMATSGNGYVVVGSDDGKVRLYSEKTLTQAKTSIPGMGLPITAVDVTFDGKWIVATTKSYLMIIKTTFKDGKGREANGFTSRMGAQAPAPRLLRLKTEDVALVGRGEALRNGKFTWVTETGRPERWIVASAGNYTVLWNFRQVKTAAAETTSYGGLTTCTNYHLIQKKESVVDSVFMHDNYATNASPGGNESSMVVVTKHNIFSMANEED